MPRRHRQKGQQYIIAGSALCLSNMLLVKYDTYITLVGYAIDVAGNPTAVFRELLHPTEDGTVPMGDFNPNELWNWGDEASSSAAGIVSGDGWMMPLIAK